MEPSGFTDVDPNSNYNNLEGSWGLAEAFEPIGTLSEEGPWSDFPTLAAWVENAYETSAARLRNAEGQAETRKRASAGAYSVKKEGDNFGSYDLDGNYDKGEMKYYAQQYAAEASELARDIPAFLATVGPTGVTYGAILDEVRARKEREKERQARFRAEATLGRVAMQELGLKLQDKPLGDSEDLAFN